MPGPTTAQNAKPHGRARRLIERVMMLCIVVLLVFIGWRLTHPRTVMTTEVRFGQPNLQDQLMVVPGRPHDIAAFQADPGSIERRVSYTWSTDAWGFRGPGVAMNKPEGGFRVAVVGECVAFGNGVEDHQPWPARLDDLLTEAMPERHVEVVNASSPDPPLQVLARLDVVVPDFDPDLVLLAPGCDLAFLDEAQRASYPGGLPPERAQHYLGPVSEAMERAFASCQRHDVPLVLVTPTFNSFGLPPAAVWIEHYRAWAAERDVPLLDTSALLQAHERREGLVFERAEGVQRLVATPDVERRLLLELPYQGDRWVAPELYAWLDEHPEVSLRYGIDENHPNPDGHALIAQAMLDLLGARGLLQGDP